MNEQDTVTTGEQEVNADEEGVTTDSGTIPLLKRFEERWAAYAPLL